jgi:hypothetical protein
MLVSACACAATLCSNITPTWCVDQPVAHAARRPPPPAAVALLTGVCAREFSPATGDDDDADGGCLVLCAGDGLPGDGRGENTGEALQRGAREARRAPAAVPPVHGADR